MRPKENIISACRISELSQRLILEVLLDIRELLINKINKNNEGENGG